MNTRSKNHVEVDGKLFEKEYQQNSFRTYFRKNVLKKHPRLHSISQKLFLTSASLSGRFHMLPDFYIIGVVKGGTTSLYEYLIKHPQVSPPSGKEIDFYIQFYSRGINWYKTWFPNKIKKNLMNSLKHEPLLSCDATPRYIEHPSVPQRIKNITPSAKFILILRNPIDRAYSHHNMNITTGHEPLSFEEAIDKESERIKGLYQKFIDEPNFFSWDYFLYAYKEHGKYVEKLEQWFKIFPKEQFLIFKSEDLFENPEKVYLDSLKFLGLKNFNLNQYYPFKKRTYVSPKMDPEIRKSLSEYFAPYNQKLYSLLNRDFDWD